MKVLLFSVVLVLFCGLGQAKIDGLPWLNAERSGAIDRFTGNFGYYLLPVDHTVFSISRDAKITKFVLPKVFGYHPKSKKEVDNIEAHVSLIQMPKKSDHNVHTKLFQTKVILNSYKEVEIELPMGISLNSNYDFDIQVNFPEDAQLMINESFAFGPFKIKSLFGKSLDIAFHQRNPNTKPAFDPETRRKLSQGLVKRVHFKYSTF